MLFEKRINSLSSNLVHFKGGGGGGTGDVGYPAYMEDCHNDWLNDMDADTISTSVTEVMNSALGSSPWLAQSAYDPDADLTAMTGSGNDLQALVTLLSTGTTLDTLISSILDQARVDDAVTEYAADLDSRLTSEVLPRFERGMQDINAVSSSAFVIGRALIEEGQDRQVAKFSADLHYRAFSEDAIKVIQLKLEYQKAATIALADIYRIKIVAKTEENSTEMSIDEKDAIWDLEVFQFGGNLLASIGGGTAGAGKQPSLAQSVIGGAMSGAAAGAMITGGNPMGAAAGAVLGAASALL